MTEAELIHTLNCRYWQFEMFYRECSKDSREQPCVHESEFRERSLKS